MISNLAYKYVAMILMLAEVNFFCDQMGIPHEGTFTYADVRSGSHVAPPNLKDFGGSILTDRYFFGFLWGHLVNFTKRGFMPQDSDGAIQERNMELSKMTSTIDSEDAYQLATNWLAALGVDVPTLERKYRLNLIQWKYYPHGKEGPVLMLPVYHVEWLGFIPRSRSRERAAVSVTVFGVTKELVEYHVLDDALFLRPRIEIKDRQKLLDIPDAEFAAYTVLQRSNLVVQSAMPSYAGYRFPEIGETKSTNTLSRRTTQNPFETKGSTRVPQPKLKTVPSPPQPKGTE